ncbi:MAG TPA: HNH endonuclease signature motif containing protein [Pirellulales bacterium]|jgi:hypothetical protein|nr:HNH endonuclease signature motif containing protein [Pirellulales bacterium]
MSSYVSADLRRVVIARAGGLCEYCLIHEADAWLGCQIDHVISEKHGGLTSADNLAYACVFCNRNKGADLGSIAGSSGSYVRFFNPRIDRWSEHFSIQGARIGPLTEIGEVTVRILELNSAERLLEREALRAIGRFPSLEAAARIR